MMQFTIQTRTWVHAKSPQSCPTLGDPMDCRPPGSSVHGLLQARVLEWVSMPSSRGSSQPWDWTQVSCLAGGFFTSATWEAPHLGHFWIKKGLLEVRLGWQHSPGHKGVSFWPDLLACLPPLPQSWSQWGHRHQISLVSVAMLFFLYLKWVSSSTAKFNPTSPSDLAFPRCVCQSQLGSCRGVLKNPSCFLRLCPQALALDCCRQGCSLEQFFKSRHLSLHISKMGAFQALVGTECWRNVCESLRVVEGRGTHMLALITVSQHLSYCVTVRDSRHKIKKLKASFLLSPTLGTVLTSW